jgi:hypothetical protein
LPLQHLRSTFLLKPLRINKIEKKNNMRKNG